MPCVGGGGPPGMKPWSGMEKAAAHRATRARSFRNQNLQGETRGFRKQASWPWEQNP